MTKASKAAEQRTLETMLHLYCRGQHTKESLCCECTELLKYAQQKTSACPHGVNKPTCKRCTIHCYDPEHRARIRRVIQSMQSGTYLDRHNSEARLANRFNSFHSDPAAFSGWLNLIDLGSACDIPFDAIDLAGRLIMKIGIIICDRYSSCGGGKCFRAMRERVGGFKCYPADEPLDIVGYSTCSGCPGGNVEYVPEEMIKNGAEAIHLATGLVVGYPPCPRTEYFKEFIESRYGTPVVIGTHPIPQKYVLAHQGLPSWGKLSTMTELLETEDLRKAYD